MPGPLPPQVGNGDTTVENKTLLVGSHWPGGSKLFVCDNDATLRAPGQNVGKELADDVRGQKHEHDGLSLIHI